MTIDATAILRVMMHYAHKSTNVRTSYPFVGKDLSETSVAHIELILSHILAELAHAVETGRQDHLLTGMRADQPDALVLQLPKDGVPFEDVEREVFVQALELHGGLQIDACKFIRMSPRTMNYRMRSLGVPRVLSDKVDVADVRRLTKWGARRIPHSSLSMES